MNAVDVCGLPGTGGSTFVLITGVFLLVAGVIVARWVRQSAGRMSVVVAPLVLLGGLALVPQVADPCAPATTTVAPSVTTVAATNSTVPSATTTVPSATTTVPSATTTVPSATTTTLAPGGYQVGPGGGIIFYDAGSIQPWGRYLEVACAGWSDGVCGGNDLTDPQPAWGCNGANISGANGTLIGTGEQNTTDIVAGCSESGIAAGLADALVLGGQSDWFLPSLDELNELCKYARSTGQAAGALPLCSGGGLLTGFSSGSYWSSSEFVDVIAWGQDFYIGVQYNFAKNSTLYVRPVRAF